MTHLTKKIILDAIKYSSPLANVLKRRENKNR